MGFENTGKVWTVATLASYLEKLTPPNWCDSVTMHHTWLPSLADRPNGFTVQHLKNLEHYYKNTNKWSSGPHLFVDDDQLWGMCDFRKKGVHAVSFNSRSIGIEVLGDYDSEAPTSGRGLACWKTAAAAASVILNWIDKKPSTKTVFFHRDDPLTTKSCPGTKVKKDWVLDLIGEPFVEAAEEVPKKPVTSVELSNSELRYEGMGWFAPASAFLTKKGISFADIKANLKKNGKLFYYGDTLLEDAFYDSTSKITWVSLRDLEALKID